MISAPHDSDLLATRLAISYSDNSEWSFIHGAKSSSRIIGRKGRKQRTERCGIGFVPLSDAVLTLMKRALIKDAPLTSVITSVKGAVAVAL